jgi:hypothetical protein
MLAVALLVGAAVPASAGSLHRVNGFVTGSNDSLDRDGFCGENPFPEFPGEMEHSVIEGTIVRNGPDATYRLDLCHEESGALGGTCYEGTIVVTANEGTITATGAGCQSSVPFTELSQYLTITGGTRAYGHTEGEMRFQACFVDGGGPFVDRDLTAGTLIAPYDPSNPAPNLVCEGDPRA